MNQKTQDKDLENDFLYDDIDEQTLLEIEDFNGSNIFETLSLKCADLGIKSKQLFYVMRIAISGLRVTPGGATDIAEILGKEETINRIEIAINNL